MQAAIAGAGQLDASAILTMHKAHMDRQPRHTPGAWRTEQVWIGGTGYGPHLAAFVPPHHCHVPGANYDDLTRGTYTPSVELPDEPPLFP